MDKMGNIKELEREIEENIQKSNEKTPVLTNSKNPSLTNSKTPSLTNSKNPSLTNSKKPSKKIITFEITRELYEKEILKKLKEKGYSGTKNGGIKRLLLENFIKEELHIGWKKFKELEKNRGWK